MNNNLFRNNVDLDYAGAGDPVNWRTRHPQAALVNRAQAMARVYPVANYVPFDPDALAFAAARAIGRIQRRRRQAVPIGDHRRNYRLHVIVQARTTGAGGVGNGGYFNLGPGHDFASNASEALTVRPALRDSIDTFVDGVLQRGNLDDGSEDGLQRITAVVVHAIWRPAVAGGCDARVHVRIFSSECERGILQCMTVKSSGNNCAFATLLHQSRSLHLKESVKSKDAEIAQKIKAFPSAKQMRSKLVKDGLIGISELVQPEHLSGFAQMMEVNLRVFNGTFDETGTAKLQAEIDFGKGWQWCEMVVFDGHYYRVCHADEKPTVCDKCHAVAGGYHLCYSQRCDDCGLLVQPDHVCARKRRRVENAEQGQEDQRQELETEESTEELRSGPSMIINDPEELTDEQVRFKLLGLLDDGDKHVLIHGAGGTGKSEYIKFITQACVRAGQMCELSSTTGISAIGINGTTVHRALGIGLNGRVARNKVQWLRQKYSQLKWLIIDECSMLPGKLLASVDCALRLARPEHKDKMFGGVRLILVGDTLQLPVVNGECFYDSAIWYDMERELEVIYLTKLYRFIDERWAKILNKVRLGLVDDEVKSALRSRQMTAVQWEELRSSGKVYTLLCARREEVCRRNNTALEKLPGEAQELQSGEKSSIKLKNGALVMLTRNHLFDQYGVANGSQGKVVDMYKPSANEPWASAWVDVRFQRCVDTVVRVKCIKENVDEQTERWVLPLQLCFALTIHKAQGATLDCVVANIGRSVFADGQAYVALSRVRSMQGLYLLDLDLTTVRVNLHQLRFENWVRKRDRVHFGRRCLSSDDGSDTPLQLRPHPLSNTYRLISAEIATVEDGETKVQDREMGLSNVPAPRTSSSMDELLVVTQRAKGRTKVFDMIVFDFETYPSEMTGEHIVYGVAAKLRSLVYDEKQKKNVIKSYRFREKPSCPPTNFMATLGVDQHKDTKDLSKAFFDWVMRLVSFQEHQWESTKHRKSVRPMYLCAYNGNRFDLFWFARYFIGHESYSSKYTTHLLTRGSSALIQLRLFSCLNLKMPVLVTHDICDILHMSLSQAVSSYGGTQADGKDVWPHFYLTDETYANLREKKTVKVTLEHFPKSSRSQVQRLVAAKELDLDNYDLYGTYFKYLSKDVDALIDVYRGFDEVCSKYSQGAHVFDFSTMAQLTWYCFVATLPKKYLTSQADGSKLRRDRGKLLTKMYRLSKEDDEFISQSIYGGCVFPRATTFTSKDYQPGIEYDDVKDYLVDADICSMYVHIMMTREYPYGEPRYASDEMIAEYEALMLAGKYKELPMGIYEIEYRYHHYDLHPSVPHRDSKGRLLWSNCAFDPETGDYSTGKFIRACVTSVDLQNIAIGSKAEVKPQVFRAFVWPMQGKLFETWVSKTFQLKNGASKILADSSSSAKQKADAKAAKSFGKLMGNACYGASAMRDVRGQFVFVRDEHELEQFFQDYEWTDAINTQRFCQGMDSMLVLKGVAKITDVNKMCRRPRYLGAFTLSYSRQMICDIVNAANPFMRKDCMGARRVAIRRQPLYGDTDSLFVTSAAAFTLYRKGYFGNQHGKLTDDQYDDWNKGTQSNGMPQWGKIVSAFFPAPKTYAVKSLLPDGSFKDGVRAKGIPNHKTNDIEITIGNEVLTKLDFDTVMKMKEYCAENSDSATPILVKAKHRMKRMGLNLHSKQREGCQELYTIHPAELEREMFKTKWSGRQYIELTEDGIEPTDAISQYTVPHGYGYKL